MKVLNITPLVASFASLAAAIILENGHIRETNYPDTQIQVSADQWKTFPPNATELSYKGRWDSKYISWWSAPGLKFGFTGQSVAVTFGPYTNNGTLLAYRVNGQDWQFTNVTTSGTHQLVSTLSPAININYPLNPSTLELRVTNWGYNVQIAGVHVVNGENLIRTPDFGRRIEVIGDSLASGMYGTFEGLSGFGYALAAGLGATEYSITARPGICLFDKKCWGNKRGQAYQWFRTSDTGSRADEVWGDKPELWDFSKTGAADLVVINIGTNDGNSANGVTNKEYFDAYVTLVQGIHGVWPHAQVVLTSVWNGFGAVGNTYQQGGAFEAQILAVHAHFNSWAYLARPLVYNATTNKTHHSKHASDRHGAKPFVHFFNTTGILQHNDIGPQWHPTDVGHIKVASHLMQYIKMTFGWELAATGPEVQHQTQYWNSEQNY